MKNVLIKVLLIGIAVLILYPALTLGSPVCLTHSEARKLWPRQHIYWYSSDHCWSNRRGPPRGIKYDLIRENHAEVTTPKPQAAEPKPTIFYPGVSYAGLPVPRIMLDHAPSTLTYRLLDIDELTSRIPDPPDCCWPELMKDADGNWSLKP